MTYTRTPTHCVASTLRMRTAISPGKWQPWTVASAIFPYLCYRVWTGTSLQWRQPRSQGLFPHPSQGKGPGNEVAMETRVGNIIEKRTRPFAFEKTPLISLSCRLVPVQNIYMSCAVALKSLKSDYNQKHKEGMYFLIGINLMQHLLGGNWGKPASHHHANRYRSRLGVIKVHAVALA